ncbi:MAG: hypothetical protein QOG03_626 [Actinomycetota bacterium]|nr:hypothetical protein [Actinomycetota bacterium]
MAPARQPGLSNLRRNAGATLQPAERRWALLGAGAAAVGFTALNLSLHSPSHLALGLVFSALLAASTFTGNRLVVAVGAVLVGFGPWNFLFIAGGPFYVLGLVLLYRARREQEAAGPAPDDSDDDDDDDAEVGTDDAAPEGGRAKPHPRSKKKKRRKPR